MSRWCAALPGVVPPATTTCCASLAAERNDLLCDKCCCLSGSGRFLSLPPPKPNKQNIGKQCSVAHTFGVKQSGLSHHDRPADRAIVFLGRCGRSS